MGMLNEVGGRGQVFREGLPRFHAEGQIALDAAKENGMGADPLQPRMGRAGAVPASFGMSFPDALPVHVRHRCRPLQS